MAFSGNYAFSPAADRILIGPLEAFSGSLRQEIDLDALHSEMLGVVRHTVQPSHATLWL